MSHAQTEHKVLWELAHKGTIMRWAVCGVNVNHFFRWYDKQIFMFFGNEFLHHCGKQIFMSGGKHFFT